jgi:hypothetical protein
VDGVRRSHLSLRVEQLILTARLTIADEFTTYCRHRTARERRSDLSTRQPGTSGVKDNDPFLLAQVAARFGVLRSNLSVIGAYTYERSWYLARPPCSQRTPPALHPPSGAKILQRSHASGKQLFDSGAHVLDQEGERHFAKSLRNDETDITAAIQL